ncbi:MAG: hypothetical protein ABI091_02855, partial [Ferruginibacter sp.]
LLQIADELTKRVFSKYKRNSDGNLPAFGDYNWFYNKEENKDLVQFFEYFDGETSRGLGASHQTGWTALIAVL